MKLKSKNFLIALAGTMLEYYDYALYGFAAASIATHFFPSHDSTVSIIQAFGVFALGPISKPLGALIFGRIGDKFGRCYSLKISMIGIAIPAAIVGLLPEYNKWGWISTFILVLCRIIQGIFVAGESDGVIIYILEYINSKYTCFANSIITLVVTIGMYIASSMVALVNLPLFPDWGWRLPFLGGDLFGILIFFLRQHLTESPQFIYQQTTYPPLESKKLTNVLSRNWRQIVVAILMIGVAGGSYHFYLLFWGTYISKIINVTDANIFASYPSFTILTYLT